MVSKRDKARRHVVAYKKVVKHLFQEQAGLCHLCGAPMFMKMQLGTHAMYDMHPTIDHVIPLGAGGANEPHNYRLAHEGCNRIKGCQLIAGVPMAVRPRNHHRGGAR